METKTCSKCSEPRPLDSFGWASYVRNGKRHRYRRSWCRACQAEYDRERFKDPAKYAEKLRKVREWKRQCPPASRAKMNKSSAKYRKSNAHKLRARWRAGRGVELRGMCQDCGQKPAVHRHHDDHTRALDVRLLCLDCHGKTRACRG